MIVVRLTSATLLVVTGVLLHMLVSSNIPSPGAYFLIGLIVLTLGLGLIGTISRDRAEMEKSIGYVFSWWPF